jgi:hypothetical protein
MRYSHADVNTHRIRLEPISIADAFTGRLRLLRCSGSAPRKKAKVPQQVLELAFDMLDQGMSDFNNSFMELPFLCRVLLLLLCRVLLLLPCR